MTGHRFGFGKNWHDYAKVINADRIATAEQSLKRDRLDGLSFLDIGSGSGLFSLAALNLGARSVLAIDIDEDSVATTQAVLSKHARTGDWQSIHLSVFDLDPSQHGRFDIVYSWGVLHHTGNLRAAVRAAGEMANQDGFLALALYKKTHFCDFWKREKRFYSASPVPVQYVIRGLYKAVFVIRKLSLGENPLAFIRNYSTVRGMSWTHDVHDWLGGYPYESVDHEDMLAMADAIGWRIVDCNIQPSGIGLLGTGCDEYLLQR